MLLWLIEPKHLVAIMIVNNSVKKACLMLRELTLGGIQDAGSRNLQPAFLLSLLLYVKHAWLGWFHFHEYKAKLSVILVSRRYNIPTDQTPDGVSTFYK